ncbi:hypothetical protein AB0B92_13675 [Streptomyces hygroscopicus]
MNAFGLAGRLLLLPYDRSRGDRRTYEGTPEAHEARQRLCLHCY